MYIDLFTAVKRIPRKHNCGLLAWHRLCRRDCWGRNVKGFLKVCLTVLSLFGTTEVGARDGREGDFDYPDKISLGGRDIQCTEMYRQYLYNNKPLYTESGYPSEISTCVIFYETCRQGSYVWTRARASYGCRFYDNGDSRSDGISSY